jgi:hypothetical protein
VEKSKRFSIRVLTQLAASFRVACPACIELFKCPMRATSIMPTVLTIVYISLFKTKKLEAASYRTFQGLISLQAETWPEQIKYFISEKRWHDKRAKKVIYKTNEMQQIHNLYYEQCSTCSGRTPIVRSAGTVCAAFGVTIL